MRVISMSRLGTVAAIVAACLILGIPGLALSSTSESTLTWLQGQKIAAGDQTAGDFFGNAIAVSGNTLIVGAHSATVDGTAQGAAYVFTKMKGVWRETQKLVASHGKSFGFFGWAVAIEGKMVFVSATNATVNGNPQGAVYVFTLKNGHWNEAQELVAANGTTGEQFGWSLAVSGNTLLVGAHNEVVNGNGGQGAVYVFTESNGSWSQTGKLSAGDGGAYDRFGSALALEGNTALIGAEGATINGSSGQGAVYVFNKISGTWAQSQKLVANDGTANGNFGRSIAVLGDEALIGAPNAGVNGNRGLGKVYLFKETTTGPFSGQWAQANELLASKGQSGSHFGYAVAFENPTTALVGAWNETVNGNFGQGIAYVFSSNNSVWSETRKLIPSDGQQFDNFGDVIVPTGDGVAIGAQGAGTVYFYGSAELGLALSVPGRVNPGSRFTSETIATNSSSAISPAVTATIGVPAAASFISATASQGSCVEASGMITCDFGPIKGNAGMATANVVLKASGNPGTVIESKAGVVQATPALTASTTTLVNHSPVAQDSNLTVTAGEATNGALKANDADGDPLTFSVVTAPAYGKVVIDNAGKGIYTYTPDKGYVGADSFTFEVNDGYINSAAATVAVNVVGKTPVAKDSSLKTDKNTSAKGSLQASDSDGDPLTFSLVAPPGHGEVKLDAATGAFIYTPNSNYVGKDSFTFKANDGRKDSNVATVSITVEGSNPPPSPPPKNNGGGGGFGLPILFVLLGLAAVSLWRLWRSGMIKLRGNKEAGMNRQKRIAKKAVLAVTLAVVAAFPLIQARAQTGAKSGDHAGLTIPLPNKRVTANTVTMTPQSSLKLLSRATEVGPHAADSEIKLEFGLRLRHVPKLKQFLQQVQYPGSPVYHHWLMPGEFTRLYGPTDAQVARVTAFLESQGIKVLKVSANHELIFTEAATTTYEHALGVRINDYKMSGRTFYSTKDSPRIPRSIAPLVMSVMGLNHGARLHPMTRPAQVHPEQTIWQQTMPPPPNPSVFLSQNQFAEAYNWPNVHNTVNAAGQTIAIIGFSSDNYDVSGAHTYWQAMGVPDHNVTIDKVGGTPGTGAESETAIDIEFAGYMAPGADIIFYEGPNFFTGLVSTYNALVTQNVASVASISYGMCDSEVAPAAISTMGALFAQAVAQGISLSAAAGDGGAAVNQRPVPVGCPSGTSNADYPASSPYMLDANGTNLTVTDNQGDYGSEMAWTGTGGGDSHVFGQPDWQYGPGVPNSGDRMTADMAMHGGGKAILFYYQGAWNAGAVGTSFVSPEFAALFADADTLNGSRLGQANKLIYQVARSPDYATDFRDVTTGSNGHPAKPNWDYPTGWGSPNVKNLLNDIGVSGPTGTLAGTVTAAASGSAIAGAIVAATGPGTSPRTFKATTTSNGRYSLVLPVGSYSVKVTDFGFHNQTATEAINKGSTTTGNFVLTAAATAKLSGAVKDNSGHGYGLYAEIKVTVAGVGQVAQVWSSPTTGAYHVKLPIGHTYSLAVTPAFDGYQYGSATVTLTKDTTHNFPLKITSTCTAPGYSFKGLSEDFNGGSFPPIGWSVVNGRNSAIGWETASEWGNGNWTGGTGDAANAGTPHIGFGAPYGSYDTSLVTPPIPVTGLPADSMLSYKANYQHEHQDAFDLDITQDGGTHWTTVLRWSSTADDCGKRVSLPGCTVQINLKPYLPVTGDVQLRWHYYDLTLDAHSKDDYAQIDDVSAGHCEPVPGGLIFGQVTDGNIGSGVVFATVSDDLGDTVNTVKNASDPNFPVGGYLFFVPAGKRKLTVYDRNYQGTSARLTLADNAVKTQNFVLKAGKLSAKPTNGYSFHVMVNNQTSKPFSVSNSGSAPARFNLVSIDALPPATANASGVPLQIIHGKFSPFSALSASYTNVTGNIVQPLINGAPWMTIADYPIAVLDNGVARDPTTGIVYSVDGVTSTQNGTLLSTVGTYDPATGSWSPIESNDIAREAPQAAFLDGRLYITGGWNSTGKTEATTEIYNPDTGTWSKGANIPVPYAGAADAALNGKWYVVGGCTATCGATNTQVYDPTTGKWTEAAPYPHPVAWESCGGIDGRLYCSGGLSVGGGFPPKTVYYTDGYVYDPSTDKWSPIPDMPANLWAAGYAAANGELLISGGVSVGADGTSILTNAGYAFDPDADRWSPLPNANQALYRGGSACGFYRIGGSSGSNGSTSSEQLPGYNQCGKPTPLSWLTAAPQSATVAAGATVNGQLIFDGTGQKEFTTSKGYLRLRGNTPYASQAIPVTVTWDPQPVNLVLTGSANADSAHKGDSLSYTLTVADQRADNHGPASEVVLSYKLPAGVTYEAASGDAACTQSSGIVTCDFGTIALGTSKAEILEVKAVAAGRLTSTFSVSAREPESNPDDNTISLTSQVLGTADVQLSAPGSTPVTESDSGVLHFKVKNDGPDPAAGVKLVAKASSGIVSLRSATASQGTCNVSGTNLSCDIGQVAAGDTVSVDLTVFGAAVGSGRVNAQASTASVDPAGDNNSIQAKVAVKAPSSPPSNGGSGGGSFGWLALAALMGLALSGSLMKRRRRS